MSTYFYKLILFSLVFLIPILFPLSTHAANYSVAPLVIDMKAEGRDIISKKITVTNNSDQPVTVYPTVNNISLSEGGVIQEFIPAVSSDRTQSLASWLEIKRLGIDMKSGESKEFDVTLRMNPNPVPGVYHAFIGFGNGRNRDDAELQVKAGQAPGTIITVTIEDKKVEALKLSGFRVDRFITKPDNQAASFSFTNPGDETLVPKGEIILYDSAGKEVTALPVNAENVSIAPQGEHTFTATLPADGFGKYKAFLSIEYGTKQRASLQDTNFYYVLPIRLIVIVSGIIILLVGLLAWHLHKKYFDPDIDDSDRLTFHVRDTKSVAKEHDVVLRQQ